MNSMLKGARNLPITALVGTIYFQLAELFTRKCRETYARNVARNIFSEAIMTRLRENQQASGNVHSISFARRHESFNVQELGQDLRVDMKDRHCDFQIDRYTCRNVIVYYNKI